MENRFSIYIVNPLTGELETPESWARSENPQSAELVALKRHGEQGGLFISKNLIKDDLGVLKVDFNDAVRLASGYKPTTVYPVDRTVEDAFRLPTRRECLDVYLSAATLSRTIGFGPATRTSTPSTFSVTRLFSTASTAA